MNIPYRGRRLPGTALFLGALLCLSATTALAQTPPKIEVEVDTLALKIGEQLRYTIQVETDTTAQVHFPEGQTFSPLETVEAIISDTLWKGDRMTLERIYALTQFDSGAYTIPPQIVTVDRQQFFTDSFQIRVTDVAVDTSKQKMFDIKPLIPVERGPSKIWKILPWVLLGLLALGAALYFLLRKKPLSQEEREALLPPYDRALLELKKLENSQYLIHDQYKEYYSQLTDIVRSYLEDEVQVSAMESTTLQLISKLEMLKDAGELKLDDGTLQQFQKILETADLVKFAKSKPATSVAEQDRKLVEEIVEKTHRAKPEPSPEELMLSQEYLEAQARKRKRKKIYWAAAILGGLLIFSAGLSVAYFGFKEVKDRIFGHPTRELLHGEWVASSYGFPPVELESPEVLLRLEVELPQETREQIKEFQAFGFGSHAGGLAISSSSITYREQGDPDFESAISGSLAALGKSGMRNIITKQEEFVTKSGVRGLKTFGTASFENPKNGKTKKAEYNILSFGGKGFIQQLVISWEERDPYGEEIVERILNSLDVKTQV